MIDRETIDRIYAAANIVDIIGEYVTLYKSKVIERMSRELREKLQDENLTDDEMQDIMQRLSNLNRGKVSIARKLHRLIL